MGNIMNLFQLLGVAKQNPQQAVMQILQQGMQNGAINKMQYDVISSQIQNGVNPNVIIQQMMNNGMVSQQQYESARQGANNIRGR
jgi:hypothetical protein